MRLTRLLLLAAGTAAAGIVPLAPVAAQSLSQLSCRALWYQRNAIYAEQGHCFKTADAVATFGPRCYPPYGKLTRQQQREVDEIMRWEARRGCN